MISQIILNGIYPTHPLWEALPLILIFEVAVICIEAALVFAFYRLIEKKEGEARAFYIWLIVAISNIVTFVLGLTIQIAFSWSL